MPKKAKKGGGAKGGGAKTEEERLLYLQQRAQAEEEMAKKKEEILTLFLKDKLQKEERNTAMNLLKLNDGWRSILRQTRAAELRKDITVLSQTFEKHLDGLDSVIKHLERDLQEAERQSAQVRRIHLQHMEQLWAQQAKHLTFVQQQWEAGLQHLSSRFSSERKQILLHSEQQRADLEDATFTVEQQHKTVMSEIHRLYRESIASYESAHEDRKAALDLEDMDKLKQKTLQHQEAVQICSKETKALDILLSKHQQFIQMADADMKKAKRLQDIAIQLRAKMNYSKIENQSVEQDLNAARNKVNRKTHMLRDQLTQAHTAARKQLTDLTVQSDKAAKKLQAVISKGEKVLRVAEMCRKLESEEKQVLSSVFPAEDVRQERAGPETEEPAKEIPELRQVTWCINAAVLQREALKKQKADLSRENQQLRLLLRQHLDAMTVSGDTLDGRHNLLTVHQAPAAAAPPDQTRRHNVIEAVHVVKHSL
ncbi:dynein regulatory complex subunit 2 [Micropterus dolomieu]|uniref:dynein regulatory complex subunit 2 n=1 Tax=Micropterus dolomieu TaxID=147949 RepID=UPI001E8D81AD|nr:dynein regulatory complex subunit 2 [Micropterus dolomieu]XP_045918105.1 dynein regulatory complex subunit 2 [Micropterus dolomieu]XP_045918106.1 dynein regulatory complex subunit 2 [Micropterus dolomieu]XP_045918107.1 dynein regulatory complex subunit 2 [Micropterus dolomieu]